MARLCPTRNPMAVSGLQSARVFPGRFVKSKVPVGGGHLGFQATRQGMRPWRRSLQTVNAKEEEKVDVKDEVRCWVALEHELVLDRGLVVDGCIGGSRFEGVDVLDLFKV